MNIDEKLKDIKDYFVSLSYGDGIPMIEVKFQDKWAVPKSNVIGVQKYPNHPNRYLFYTEHDEILVDDMIDYIKEIIKTNIEREQKYLLLKSKIMELQQFFGEHSLKDLEKLTFTIEEDKMDFSELSIPMKQEQSDEEISPAMDGENIEEEEKVED